MAVDVIYQVFDAYNYGIIPVGRPI